MERANGFEPSTPTLARLCSTTELRPHINNMYKDGLLKWSGRRDSNPRQPAWKAGTLATELRPHITNYVGGTAGRIRTDTPEGRRF